MRDCDCRCSVSPRRAPALLLPALLLLTLLVLPRPGDATTYAGRAYGVHLDLPTLGVGPLEVADTGPLPATGGRLSAFLVNVQINDPGSDPVLTAVTLADTTCGTDGETRSLSRVEGLSLLPGSPAALTASTVESVARSGCMWSLGSSLIEDLTFGGLSVQVTGAPGQTVTLPGVATLVINEQIEVTASDGSSIVVNALHLTLVTGEEAIVASAASGVDGCPGPTPVEISTWGGLKKRFDTDDR